MTVEQPDDTEEMRTRRKALAERELALKEAEVESRIRDLWWSTPRIMAAAGGFFLVAAMLAFALGFMLTRWHG